MSTLLRTVLLGALLGLAAPAALAAPATPEADWDAFSDNLVAALASHNDGLRASALQLLVHHGDRVDLRRALFDVVRLYRDHPDARMRRLAVVALGRMESVWARDFLRRSLPYERSPEMRQTIQAVLASA